MESKYYTKFGMRATGELEFVINCNLIMKELSYEFDSDRYGEHKCIGIQLTYDDIELIKPYIIVENFEKYRNVSRYISRNIALLSYIDGWTMEFEGISESEIPIIQLTSDCYGYSIQPPVEELHLFLVYKYFSRNKIYRSYYGK